MSRFILFIVSASWLAIGCSMKLDDSQKDPKQRITNFLDNQIKNSDLPGVQYVVVDSNSIVMEYASGYADIKEEIALESNTTMMAYSMTKTFTAVAVLQLVEKGLIDLDDPVVKYLPTIPYGNKITIRQLIAHTSGIPNPIPLKWAHTSESHLEYDEAETLSKILKEHDKLSFKPGKKFAYSNIGYWLLGSIIEEVTNQSYSEYMTLNLFNKLGFDRNELSFTITNPEKHAKGYLAKYSFINLIKGFLLNDELIGQYENDWLHIPNHYLNGPAFGGLIGTSKDIAVFLQDQLKSESVILGKEMKALLYKQETNNSGDTVEMTAGWHIGELNDVTYYFKEGGGGGYHSEMRVYPSHNIGTVIIVNRTNFNSGKYLNTLDEAVLSRSSN